MAALHERFWTWFATSEARLRALPPEALAFEIEAQLRDVDPRIGIELAVQPDATARREVIFTAFGAREAFAEIRALVAAAPPALPHWQLIALKPPKGFTFRLSSRTGVILSAAELTFSLPPAPPGQLTLRLFVDAAHVGTEDIEALAWIVVETAIGEEAAATITRLEVATPTSDDTPLPLSDLPSLLAAP